MSEKRASAFNPGFGSLNYPAIILSFFVPPAVALAAFSFPLNEGGLNALLLLLALVAIAGLSVSFAMTSGLFRFTDQELQVDVTRLICAAKSEGLIVTNQKGKVIYANDSYLRLTGASHREVLRNIEQFFSGSPEMSAPLYRLAQAVRLGNTEVEEVRLSPPLDHQGYAVWYKIKAVPLQSGIDRLNLWSVEDVTGEREKEESVFRECQEAVDFLDHASVGFFSSQANGKVSYMNATLANWLGYPSCEAVSASLKLADFIVESSSPHFASLTGKTGETLNTEFDIELKDCRGQILPAHVLHHVTIEQDGVPGTSRALVLSRRLNDRPAENVADAQNHFGGVFNATPMAIAIADKTGRITCSNTAFARLMPLSVKADIHAGIAADDHALVNAALAAAFQGRTDIPPTDVKLAGDGNRSARLFISAADEMSGRGATIYALDTSEQRALQNSLAQS
ncbi:MAG: PAS domain-containing protein, partial [Alphaproteobacteria bacterium]|nr:PAS domain-containing protein [Alphaproteobacteria bacterium]